MLGLEKLSESAQPAKMPVRNDCTDTKWNTYRRGYTTFECPFSSNIRLLKLRDNSQFLEKSLIHHARSELALTIWWYHEGHVQNMLIMVPDSWSPVGERALSTGLCAEGRYSEYSRACRRTERREGVKRRRRSERKVGVWSEMLLKNSNKSISKA